ncbi:unnamed protein product, partial [Durusdinium trenchii]
QELLSSELYMVPAGASITALLQLEEAALLRLVAEPADILAPRLLVELQQGSSTISSNSATGAGFVSELQAGIYQMVFRSTDQAAADAIPFFVTWGLARSGAGNVLGNAVCDGVARMMDLGADSKSGGSSWQWKRQLNLRALPSSLKLPLLVPRPSVATIGSWSSFVHHYVRVALVTEEGLWVGEQRGRRSSLEIELPAGNYQMILEEMMPLSPAPAGCMAMGVAVSLVPFSVIERPATTGATPSLPSAPSFLGAALGLGAACDALGAKPLPLDAISSTGGSAVYGGPVDDGRLLMRERVMLTDIHDGRKKVFLRLPAAAMLRVAVVSGDAEATEVVLEDGNHQPIAPAESHIMGVGQAASYILEAGGALWLSFHREHRVAASAGCASFDLLVQSAPMQDLVAMSSCGSDRRELRDLVEQLHAVGDSAVASAEGRVVVGGGAAATLALQLAEETLVEVEVQFNFLLSNVHLWLQTPGAGRSRAVRAPRVRALGLASAVRNARAVLRLRLHPGEHVVNFRHDPAFPKDAGPIKLVVAGGQCAPLALKLRRLRLPNARPVATAPMAPLAAGSDLVLRFALGHSTSRDGTEEALDAELGTAQFPVRPKASSAVGGNGGFVTVAWPSDVLEQVSQNSGAGHPVQVQDGASRIWALPLHFSGGNGEIWVALYRGKSGKPWAGGTAPPVSAPPGALASRRPGKGCNSVGGAGPDHAFNPAAGGVRASPRGRLRLHTDALVVRGARTHRLLLLALPALAAVGADAPGAGAGPLHALRARGRLRELRGLL